MQIGPNDILYGPAPHPLWLTIFTSMFLHGSLLHIGGNMLYLWIFGNNVEDVLGKGRFLLFYLACGVAASMAQIAIGPNSLVPNLGASGAIAGVLGAYFILYPDAPCADFGAGLYLFSGTNPRVLGIAALDRAERFSRSSRAGNSARWRRPLRPHRRLLRRRSADYPARRTQAGCAPVILRIFL